MVIVCTKMTFYQEMELLDCRCILVAEVLAWHAHSPRLDPQQHITWVWWFRTTILLTEHHFREAEVQSHP